MLERDPERDIVYQDMFDAGVGPKHVLAKADNACFLMALPEILNGEKVDIVYIDPPYNTGKKFDYNDSYDDWFSFMERRLFLLPELLSPGAFVFISIGVNEFVRLKTLCDSVFGPQNFVTMFTRQTGTTVKQDSQFVADAVDYVFMYAKDKAVAVMNRPRLEVNYPLRDAHYATRGAYKERILSGPRKGNTKPIDGPEGDIVPSNGHAWRWGEEHIKWGEQNDFIIKKKRGTEWQVYYKQYERVNNYGKPIDRKATVSPILLDFPNSKGTADLERVLGKKTFAYPKPVDLVKFLIQLHPSKDATVLDFFCGTGTTGQAVLELNALGANRRVLLCTNDEGEIFEGITYPRMQLVCTGWCMAIPDRSYENMTRGSMKIYKEAS